MKSTNSTLTCRAWNMTTFLHVAFPFILFIQCGSDPDPKIPVADFTVSPDLIYVGDIVYFDNTSIHADSYTWYFGDNTSSSEVSPTHIYTSEGDYSVLLTASNDDKTVSKEVFLEVLPPFDYWEKHYIEEGVANPASMMAGDIDGDGDMDLAATIWGETDVIWYENDNGEWIKHMVDNQVGGVGIVIKDVDGDQIPDIVVAGFSSNLVIWYKNEGGSPISWTPYTIDDNLNAEFVDIADFDLDGDMDAVATGAGSNLVVYYENTGGSPISWVRQSIDNSLNISVVCLAADIDGDDTLDIVANGMGAGDVVWYHNQNAGKTWTKFTIDGNLSGVSSVHVGDIDGDNDQDVVASGTNMGDVVWYENEKGIPDVVVWNKRIIDKDLSGAFSAKIADMNGDGTMDVVATATSSKQVTWYANDGGSPPEWTKNIIDHNLNGAWEIIVADFNNDNLPDIAVHQWLANGNVVWYEQIMR